MNFYMIEKNSEPKVIPWYSPNPNIYLIYNDAELKKTPNIYFLATGTCKH